MRRRHITVLLAILLIAAAVAILVVLRRGAAPEPVRLLPEADGYLYVNLKAIRRAAPSLPAVSREPDYEDFVRATGFQFERDLDEAAFAIHAATPGPNDTEIGSSLRFSEVFVARFNSARLAAYLRRLAGSVENYRDLDVYAIPHEGRIVRVAILNVNSVAVSNTSDSLAIHDIIDHSKELARPFAGPTPIRDHYRDVPFGSFLWLVARLARSGSAGSGVAAPSLLRDIAGGSTLVASIRFLGNLQLRAEAIAADAAQAKKMADDAGALLALYRSAETPTQASGADPDVRALLESVKVEQRGDRAVLTASVPLSLLKKLVSGPPEEILPVPPKQPQPPAAPPKKKRRAH